jgi:hypothetical protein
VSVSEESSEAPDALPLSALHGAFQTLGFRSVGRINDVTPKMQPTNILGEPTPVLAASDESAFLVVGSLWGRSSVRITTALSTGAIVETRRILDHEPGGASPKLERVDRYHDPVREQTLSHTPGSGRSIELAEGDASELWAAHREHVRRWTAKNGGGPIAHCEMRQMVSLLNLLFAHDLKVVKRLRNRSWALPLLCFLVLLPIDMGLTPTHLGWLVPGALVAWLVVSFALVRDLRRWTTKLRYTNWIRPDFL